MSDLTANTEYLQGLAKTQRDASGETRSAVTSTADVRNAVWKTHGVYTGFGNHAIGVAVSALEAASEAMAMLSDKLADDLDKAGKTYEGVDRGLGQDLDPRVGST
jgi:uncharacterized protein YukE